MCNKPMSKHIIIFILHYLHYYNAESFPMCPKLISTNLTLYRLQIRTNPWVVTFFIPLAITQC